MGATDKPLEGPDLAQGVPEADVPDGGMLLGHAHGAAVLLARRGGTLFATGATCTHYGGPLAEGLLVGDEVRCPWHHACFDLRTGEPRAPALNPIPCFEVVREGGRVRVGARLEPVAKLPPAGAPASVVIVGGGAAGHAAAELLRREGYGGRLTLISADPAGPVDRPNLSKDYLAGTAPEEWIPLRPPEFFTEQRIDLLTGARVTAIAPRARTVTLDDGRVLDYEALLLATGAEPVRLAVPGADAPHVHYLRTLADSRAIIAAAAKAQVAVVVGASFIGLEAAASLRTRGLDVHVVAPGAVPLGRVMGPELGGFVRALHEQKGVRFHLGRKPAAIAADSVTLDDGTRLPADLVVCGVGVRPAVDLARAAGLATADGGVSVDAHLETSERGIYAAGDIASYPDPRSGRRARIEHWVVAQRQGQCAARNILGRRTPFTDVPFFWSMHYDVPIAYVGYAPGWEEARVHGSIESRDFIIAYRSGGKVLATASVYRDRDALAIEAALAHDDQAEIARILAQVG